MFKFTSKYGEGVKDSESERKAFYSKPTGFGRRYAYKGKEPKEHTIWPLSRTVIANEKAGNYTGSFVSSEGILFIPYWPNKTKPEFGRLGGTGHLGSVYARKMYIMVIQGTSTAEYPRVGSRIVSPSTGTQIVVKRFISGGPGRHISMCVT
jgi:hypothetical protein